MKVLMLSWEYPPHNVGGLGKHVTELVPALARAGVEVHLITPRWVDAMGEEVIQETDVTSTGRLIPPTLIHRVAPPVADLGDFFTGAWRTNVSIEQFARPLLTTGNYDVIHVHDWLVAFSGIPLKHACNVPLVATIHATEYGRGRGKLNGEMPRAIHDVEWWLTYEAWRIVCCSEFMSNEIGTAFHTPSDKIDIVPNGVDTTRFDALQETDLTEFRRDYALDHESLIFYVGRIVQEKGVHVLLDAMPAILERRPNAKLVIAGTGGSLAEMRERSTLLGLDEKVHFTGFISDDDRDALMTVADVAVFPSLYEPFGITALEAMAARTPVVVADVGGLSEVVQNHVTGITVHTGDIGSLVWGILHTLDNPAWAQMRVANAYEALRSKFNWDTIAVQTRAVYQQVIDERTATTW